MSDRNHHHERYIIRHFAPDVDVPPVIVHKRQRFHFSSARMSKAIKGGIVARFVMRG
jgi:hypothetical protein